MAVHNASIADTLRHIADLLEIEGANPFRVRAYRRAAQTIEDLPQSAAKIVVEGRTVGLPGIGKDLAGKITELVTTGRLVALQEIEARTPTTLAVLTTILASAQSALRPKTSSTRSLGPSSRR
jgi:DNA polymerase (family 10)